MEYKKIILIGLGLILFAGTVLAADVGIKLDDAAGGSALLIKDATSTEVARINSVGTIEARGFKLLTGATNNYVLTSDPSGNGTWKLASSGSVTQINTGNGLTGGPITTIGTISADYGGSGSDYGTANTLARSDHLHDARYLKLNGGTMSGSLDLGSNKITSLAAPTVASDAANKGYVDSQIGGTIGGSGTDNYLPLWNGSNSLEASTVYQASSGNIGLGTTNPINGSLEVYSGTAANNAIYGKSAYSNIMDPSNWVAGVKGETTATGISSSEIGVGVYGAATTGAGDSKLGVFGFTNAGIGVMGLASSSGTGVNGESDSGTGVHASSKTGYSGVFDGGKGIRVEGTIETYSTGGVKFPDGSLQTTAFSPSSSYWTQTGSDIYNANSGKVGIGTSTPTNGKLEVNSTSGTSIYGSTNVSESKGVYGLSSSSSGAGMGVYGESGGINGYGVYGKAANTAGMCIGVWGLSNSTSGVGIKAVANSATGSNYAFYGQTNSPDGYGGYFTGGKGVMVIGTIETADGGRGAGIKFPDGTTQLTAATGNVSGSGTINYLPLWSGSSTLTDSGIYQSSGNVGIGTASPGANLHVVNSTTGQAIIGISTGGGTGVTAQSTSGTGTGLLATSAGGYSVYALGPKNYFEGDVGIGTTSPSAKLDVNGNAKATAFESTVSTGTAPLTVASNTKVTNLNADLLDGSHSTDFASSSSLNNYVLKTGDTMTGSLTIDAAGANLIVTQGKVGIGTNNPGPKLDVKTVSGGSASLGGVNNVVTGDHAVAIGENNTANQQETFAVGFNSSAEGVQSIAMGLSSVASGTQSVAVGYDAIASGGQSMAFGRNVQSTNGGSFVIGLGEVPSGSPLINNKPDSLMVGFLHSYPTLYVDEDNVGIGTSEPDVSAKLEVAGQVKITGGSPGAGKVLTSDGNGLANWQTPSGNISGSGASNYLPLWSGSSTLTDSVIYQSSGNVGIGTTSPGAKLDVNTFTGGAAAIGDHATAHGDRSIAMGSSVSAEATNSIVIGSGNGLDPLINNTQNSLMVGFNSTTPMLYVDQNRVGIGTTSPNATLEVNGNVKATAFESTISTGTAPFTVASSTKVTNLNADLIDGLNSTDFASSSSLNNYVLKAGDTMTGTLTVDAAGANLIINQGNVSIGTPEINATVTVNGDISLREVSGRSARNDGYGKLYANDDQKLRYKDSAGNEYVLSNYGLPTRVAFWKTGGEIGSNANFYWDDTNSRLGIGTASPAYKLDVAGDVNISSGQSYRYNGVSLAMADPAKNNYFFGEAGNLSMTGTSNIGTGFYALSANTDGLANIAYGGGALRNNDSGFKNTAIGDSSLYSNAGLSASENTAIGYQAGYYSHTGGSNVFVGASAGYGTSSYTGSNNTIVGYYAGDYLSGSQSGNVFLGAHAGHSETGNNKLYINNSASDPPLIYGDFSTGNVGIGTTDATSKLTISGSIEFKSLTDQIIFADGTAQKTAGATGSGAANRVAFWSGPFNLSSNANLYWDDTNSRLGIGTSEPQSKLDVNGDISGGGMLIASSAAGSTQSLASIMGATYTDLIHIPVYIAPGTSNFRGKIRIKVSGSTDDRAYVKYTLADVESGAFYTVSTSFVDSDTLEATVTSSGWTTLIIYGKGSGSGAATCYVNSFTIYSSN